MLKYKIQKNVSKLHNRIFKLCDTNLKKMQNFPMSYAVLVTRSFTVYHSKLGEYCSYVNKLKKLTIYPSLCGNSSYLCGFPQTRYYSSVSEENKLPSITDFPVRVISNPLMQLKCLYLMYFLIRPTMDSELYLPDFLLTTRKVKLISLFKIVNFIYNYLFT